MDEYDDNTTAIPEEFWSEYSERPFEVCIECEIPLEEGRIPYAIQKHVVAGEAVFEMALCVTCASRLQQEFSVESRQAIVEFIRNAPERRHRQAEASSDETVLAHEVDASVRRSALATLHRIRRERALGCCGLCGKPRTDCHRYSIGTACLGMAMLSAAPDLDNLGSPFLICEDCELQLNECISRKTRDAWDRFVEDLFDDGPPGLTVDPRELVAIF